MTQAEKLRELAKVLEGMAIDSPYRIYLNAGADALEATEWRPIETAPHSGPPVLVAGEGYVVVSVFNKASHVPIYGWLDLHDDPENISLLNPAPTHWMPRPKPPTEKAPGD